MGFRSVPKSEWEIEVSVGHARRELLYLDRRPEVVADDLAGNASLTSICCDPGRRGELVGCSRIWAVFNVDADIIDVFFNSRCGYRAMYYLSTEEGVYYNRYVIDLLQKRIDIGTELNDRRANLSLDSPHAKIWMTNEEVAFGPKAKTIHVGNTRREWELPFLGSSSLALFGGFLDDETLCYATPENKRKRSYELFDKGFS